MALTAPRAHSAAAAALVRAGLLDDPDAGVLIMRQNGIPRDEAADDLVFSLAGIAVRALLSAAGGEAGTALALIDQWIGQYARHDAAGGP